MKRELVYMNHGTLWPKLNVGTDFTVSCMNWPTDHRWLIERKALFLTVIYIETLTEFTS